MKMHYKETNLKVFVNDWHSKFGRTFLLVCKNLLRNERTYIFCLLLPLVTCAVAYMIWHKFSVYRLLPTQVIGIYLTPCFITAFYINFCISEWRRNDFLQRMKIIGINSWSFALVIFLINFIFSLVVFYFCIGFNELISSFSFMKFIDKTIFSYFDWYVYIYITIGLFLLSISCCAFYCLISFTIRNKVICTAALFIALLSIFIMSETIIVPSFCAENKLFAIANYLNPIKYSVWFIYFFTSYAFIDQSGLYQIVPDIIYAYSIISFSNLFIPLVVEIIISSAFITIAGHFIKWDSRS